MNKEYDPRCHPLTNIWCIARLNRAYTKAPRTFVIYVIPSCSSVLLSIIPSHLGNTSPAPPHLKGAPWHRGMETTRLFKKKEKSINPSKNRKIEGNLLKRNPLFTGLDVYPYLLSLLRGLTYSPSLTTFTPNTRKSWSHRINRPSFTSPW